MSRSLTTICLVGLVALIAACSSPRKASERACRKADKHLARAVWLCPDALKHDSATVTFSLPGDSADVTVPFTDPLVDSLLLACQQYAEAVATDRALLERTLDNDSLTIAQLELRVAALQRANATASVRRSACAFTAFEQTIGLCTVRVRPGPQGPMLTVVQAPLDTAVTAPCPPQVTRPPCPSCPDGVATWWRTAAILLFLILILSHLRRIIGMVISVRTWARMPQG